MLQVAWTLATGAAPTSLESIASPGNSQLFGVMTSVVQLTHAFHHALGWVCSVVHAPITVFNEIPKEGVILSVMFDDTNGTESPLFTHFGAPAAV